MSPKIIDEHLLKIDECERQMLILAMAELALSRPGFDHPLKAIAQRIDNQVDSMYDAMKRLHADRIAADSVIMPPFFFLRDDKEELRRWIHGINQHEPTRPGEFLTKFASAVCMADAANYPILRPAVIELQAKFPKYRFAGEL